MKRIWLLIPLFFSACTVHYTQHDARYIVLKTPKFTYADAGFIHYNDDDAIKLEIFVAGQAAMRLEIGRKICLDGLCLKKSTWIKEYFHPDYPAEILQSIVLGKPIFNAKNMQKESNGFTQSIVTPTMHIRYSVTPNSIRFKDRSRNILIKIKKLATP